MAFMLPLAETLATFLFEDFHVTLACFEMFFILRVLLFPFIKLSFFCLNEGFLTITAYPYFISPVFVLTVILIFALPALRAVIFPFLETFTVLGLSDLYVTFVVFFRLFILICFVAPIAIVADDLAGDGIISA